MFRVKDGVLPPPLATRANGQGGYRIQLKKGTQVREEQYAAWKVHGSL
jgi:hypothetical protein